MNWEWFVNNCFQSLQRVFIGVLIAFFFGVPLGLIRAELPNRLRKNFLFNFLIDIFKFPPPIAWIPFVILFFGIGEISAYVLVFIGAFPPIFSSTYKGALSTPQIYRDISASLEINRFGFIIRVLLPSSLPYIFQGLRMGASMGWMSVIAAELVAGQSGLGYSIQLNRINLQYDFMVYDMIAIGFLGFLILQIVDFLEKYFVPWESS